MADKKKCSNCNGVGKIETKVKGRNRLTMGQKIVLSCGACNGKGVR